MYLHHMRSFDSDLRTLRCRTFLNFYSFVSVVQELLKKCQQCMSVIVHAKELQEKEAAKNASILLQQVDMEKEREEVKKQAAARRRERKKRKKKIKMAKEENDKMAGKDEDGEDDEEGMVIMKEESEGDQQEKSQGRGISLAFSRYWWVGQSEEVMVMMKNRGD